MYSKSDHVKYSIQFRIFAIRLYGFISKPLNFRGFWRFCHIVGAGVHPETAVSIKMGSGRLEIPLKDPYWSQMICSKYRYEPEIQNFLLKNADPELSFVDCGANIGFWSVFAAIQIGVTEITSIEPNPEIFKILAKNLKINSVESKLIEGAISDEESKTVYLFVPRKRGFAVAGSLTNLADSDLRYEVKVVSLYEVISKAISVTSRVIVKLDIEGAEIAAFESIRTLLDRDLLIIFEDHGNDSNSKNLKWFLENSSYNVYFIESSGNCVRVENILQANRFKQDKRRGYNFLATGNNF